jgi:hypothetical protein
MKAIRNSLLVAAVLATAVVCASQTTSDSPKIIEIITEQGSLPGGSGLEALLRNLKAQQNSGELRWIGTTVIAGDLNHTVAIFEHTNYASLQQSNQAVHAAWESLPAGQRPTLQSRVYNFSPEQSYNDGHVPWSQARAFKLASVQLNVGGYDEYVEQQRVASEYLAKARIQNEEWLGYDQQYGPQYPAYMFVTPLRSLSDLGITEAHGPILPEWVDRARSVVLLKSVSTNSISLILVRAELSSAPK